MTQVVRDLVVDALRESGDEGRQRHLWFASSGLEASSFTECMSRLLDDSGLSDALDGPLVVYTTEIDARLRELRTLLSKIDDSRSPEAILADHRLRRVRALALRILSEAS